MNNLSTVHEITQLWMRILEKTKDRLNDNRIFDAFFADSYIYSIDGDQITVIVNCGLAQQVISKNYIDLLTSVVYECTESNYKLIFALASDVENNVRIQPTQPSLFKNAYLKPDMTFDNFVVGPCNREAYQASVMVASDNSKKLFSPNPLFLYSQSGLGKTHLLHAIGNSFKESSPNKKVLYISADDFFDEYIHVVRGERPEQSLQEHFRSIDLLLIDDVQFFTGKEKCQRVFFDVFAAMINSGRQVVVASDKTPQELQGIENRLITRFAGGLTVGINPPDLETSKSIMKLHITSNGVDPSRIDEDVYDFYSEKFSSSVRNLDGAIKRLLFYTINIKPTSHINLEIAIEAVRDTLKAGEAKTKITERRIIETVAAYYSLNPDLITGSLRTNQIALARHISMYLVRTLLDVPFIKIGEIFGGKDHTTVMTAVRKVEKSLKTDADLQATITELKKRLGK